MSDEKVPQRSWHGSRPPEENHIVVAAYRERDAARAERDRYKEALERIVALENPGVNGDWLVAREALNGDTE